MNINAYKEIFVMASEPPVKPFMLRNGCTDGNGWWIRNDNNDETRCAK